MESINQSLNAPVLRKWWGFMHITSLSYFSLPQIKSPLWEHYWQNQRGGNQLYSCLYHLAKSQCEISKIKC